MSSYGPSSLKVEAAALKVTRDPDPFKRVFALLVELCDIRQVDEERLELQTSEQKYEQNFGEVQKCRQELQIVDQILNEYMMFLEYDQNISIPQIVQGIEHF